MSGPGRRSRSGPGRIRGPWPRPPAGWSACPGRACLARSAWLPSGRVRRALAVCTRIAGLARRSGPTGTHRLARRHGSARTRRIARRHATARRRVIARPRWRTAVLGVGHPARARSARSRRVASSLRLSGSLRVTRSRRIGSSGGIGRPRRVSRTRRVRRARRIPGSRHAPGFLRTGSPWRVTAPGGIRRPLRVGRSGGVGGSGGVGRSGWVRGPRRVSRPGRRSRPSGDRGPRAAGPGSRAAGRRPWAAGQPDRGCHLACRAGRQACRWSWGSAPAVCEGVRRRRVLADRGRPGYPPGAERPRGGGTTGRAADGTRCPPRSRPA